MPFAKILCPIDFSPGAERALSMAIRIAARQRSELVIAHVVYAPTIAAGMDNPAALDLDRIGDDAEDQLAELARRAKREGVERATCKLVIGVPWSEIVELLAEGDFDLCAIGTQARTGVSRVLLGSVAEKVVRHAPCSVFAVHPDDATKPFTHILVPTDFSESATVAARFAAEVVQPQGRITLLHVVELPVAIAGSMPVEGVEREIEHRAIDSLRDAARTLASLTPATVDTATRVGNAVPDTLHVLDIDPSIDLVITGSHGRTGIKRVLLGSVAEKLVRQAKCPVLVARHR